MSFLIYPIVFSFSCGLLYLSDRVIKKQRGAIVFFALLIPSFVFGCRDYSMGYDVLHYGNRYFEMATKMNTFEYIEWMSDRQIEPLYTLLNKFVSYFTSNPNVLYIVQTFIILYLIYLVAKDNGYPSDVCVFSFFGFMLIDSFNILRQYLAMAVILYSYIFIRRKKIIKYVICIIIGIGFHSTAIIGLFFWPLSKILSNFKSVDIINSIKNDKKVKKRILIIGIIALLIVFNFNQLSSLLIQIGIFPERYVFYETMSITTIAISSLISRFPLLILFIIRFYKNEQKSNSDYYFLLTMLIIEIVLSQLGSLGSVYLRIAYYFAFFRILVSGKICTKDIKNNNRLLTPTAFRILTYSYIFLYFILVYFIVNDEGFYSSTILGI